MLLKSSIMDHLHWRCFLAKMPVTVTEYVLALATLGDATKIETILSYVMPPKVAKASTVLCCCRWHYCAYFDNGNTALQSKSEATITGIII